MISDEELDLMKRQNERNAKYLHRMGTDGVRANRHRTTLLAEVDRQRAEIKRLTRERDEARYFLKIFVHAHASNNAVPPHLEEQARKALEGNTWANGSTTQVPVAAAKQMQGKP